jgi:hypothetical protein
LKRLTTLCTQGNQLGACALPRRVKRYLEEIIMADSSGSSAILGVIIGAVIVIAVAFYAFGGFGGGSKSTTVNVGSAAPSAPASTK